MAKLPQALKVLLHTAALRMRMRSQHMRSLSSCHWSQLDRRSTGVSQQHAQQAAFSRSGLTAAAHADITALSQIRQKLRRGDVRLFDTRIPRVVPQFPSGAPPGTLSWVSFAVICGAVLAVVVLATCAPCKLTPSTASHCTPLVLCSELIISASWNSLQ